MENKKQENWEERLEGAKYIGYITLQASNFDVDINVKSLSYSDFLLILETFHTNEVHMHTENDEWWSGIRADHFVVEFGGIEYTLDELGLDNIGIEETYAFVDEESTGKMADFCLVTGNHKGCRRTAVLLLDPNSQS